MGYGIFQRLLFWVAMMIHYNAGRMAIQ